MAYDERLADRVRAALTSRPRLTERKMFGGIAFMLSGNMATGVIRDDLIVRLDPEEGERALAEPHVRMFDLTGRPMTGFVLVGREATATEEGLNAWVARAAAFAESLPPK
jgi:TfoX/Sxy family transcriptional regulator of competence genes